jgi:hypothetical protein
LLHGFCFWSSYAGNPSPVLSFTIGVYPKVGGRDSPQSSQFGHPDCQQGNQAFHSLPRVPRRMANHENTTALPSIPFQIRMNLNMQTGIHLKLRLESTASKPSRPYTVQYPS